VNAALQAFYGKVPPWTDTHDPCTPEGVAALLDDLRGQVSITDLARRAGLSRHSVSRWLSGRTQPRLPDFLGLVEAASLRMVDLVVALVGPEAVPSLRAAWERLEARRAGAARFPWLQAVLRVLELERYRARPAHDDDWVARQLGIEADQVRASIEFLLHTGQVRRRDDHIVPEVFSVDTRGRPEVSRALKSHWTRVAAERIDASAPGQFSYNVFTVSEADFERIRQLHLDYFRALRAIVAESEPGEVVAVANVQLFGLHGGGE
jgi:DNA-binding phage protein